jgi:hypothetical protein
MVSEAETFRHQKQKLEVALATLNKCAEDVSGVQLLDIARQGRQKLKSKLGRTLFEYALNSPDLKHIATSFDGHKKDIGFA